MNAIVSLCHYCDDHGPTVVFTTQTCKEPNNINPDEKEILGVWKYGVIKNLNMPQNLLSSCKSCASIPADEVGFVTNDVKTKISFVSSRLPLDTKSCQDVRIACTRSLSCEAGPHKEGVFCFGDEVRGNVITYPFYLQDHKSRGKRRFFSILIFMRDQLYLLNSWNFLVHISSDIIHDLQMKATKVYSKEVDQFPRAAESMPEEKPRNTRPFTELTDTNNMLEGLHYQFTWMLTVGDKRMRELPLYSGTALQSHHVAKHDHTFLMQLVRSTSDWDLKTMLHTMYTGNMLVIDTESCISPDKMATALQLLVPEKLSSSITVSKVSEGELDALSCLQLLSSIDGALPKMFTTFVTARKSSLQPFDTSSIIYSLKVTAAANYDQERKLPQIVRDVAKLLQKNDFAHFSRDITILLDDWKQKARLWAIARIVPHRPKRQCADPKDLSYYKHYMMAENIPMLSSEEHLEVKKASTKRKMKVIGITSDDIDVLSKWAYIFGFSTLDPLTVMHSGIFIP